MVRVPRLAEQAVASRALAGAAALAAVALLAQSCRCGSESGPAPAGPDPLGRAGEALGAFRLALAANPGLPTARLGEALLLARTGDRAGARVRLQALLRDDPGQARARGALLDLGP